LTVAPNDAPALAAAIKRLLDDEALAAEFGAAGRRRIKEEFDQQSFIRRVHAVYEEVHARSRG
jgi:glycosyltransferase involved in cell wall biosynthesis